MTLTVMEILKAGVDGVRPVLSALSALWHRALDDSVQRGRPQNYTQCGKVRPTKSPELKYHSSYAQA